MKVRFGKWMVMGAALAATVVSGAGCLTRPVSEQAPTTKVNFTSTVSQQQVDKLDLLLMIDNSASMGDKQEILADAVPQLVKGLLTPKCVSQVDQKPQDPVKYAQPTGPNATETARYGCDMGYEPEFKPVSDMHIGILSSSLGSLGGDVCPETGRTNDRAHLLNIVKGGGNVAKAQPSNFLAWFPNIEENTGEGADKRHPRPTTPSEEIGQEGNAGGKGSGLIGDFQELVKGVDQNGCGLEAQLESFYRFLVQPDPWANITVANNKAQLNGVDAELLAQRADFLRPDSLVAIVMLTDEDDSSADPLSVDGQGWAFMANQFPGSSVYRGDGKTTTAPRATSTCSDVSLGGPLETGYQADGKTPNGKTPCTSCGFAATCNAGDPVCQKIKADPECQKNGGYYGPNEDQLNVRFHRMKERYGIDPQYPIQRYVDGLTKTRVPDRAAEHVRSPNGSVGDYSSTGKCTNPLFAKTLPRKEGDELCALPRSTRTSDLVFFAVVGGVPNQLLPEIGSDTAVDWKKILGADPASFDYTGIDPHMIQSVSPRPGLPPPSNTRGDNGDPNQYHGREYDTQGDDLQYACTFDLPTKRTCTSMDPSCDCAKANVIPPLCGTAVGDQIKAKAYPTIREFKVVKALGDQGIISSLCPITLKGDKQDVRYGYNPAVAAIIERLKNALTTQCLPQKLQPEASGAEKGEVPCLVLATLGDPAEKCSKYGLSAPPADILAKFRETQKIQQGDIKDAAGAVDLTKLDVCQLPQLVVQTGESCKADPKIGWCYVENKRDDQGNPVAGQSPAGRCPQALIFSKASGALAGAQFSLQCINQFTAGGAAGDPAKPDGG